MNKAEYQDFDQELIGFKLVIMVNILTLNEIYIEYTQNLCHDLAQNQSPESYFGFGSLKSDGLKNLYFKNQFICSDFVNFWAI